ncbi:phosphoglycerate mutase [Desulfofundulus australicus DSM 11792]|uniref:Alpha-ribazole phosphatase n=1 Tax=Desulfofundulus australicus DSM 11792 TaxID=1121425 RepID=A0A1M4ZMY5_9FIRM|nr:alpha-ribazole phosphatase [Desulfofundulus australicus]SHF19167.1 phosphoglycerate mutase [Desulfofundulus australicus DSM 11792]
MSCRIYLVRHGETVWNAEFRFQGHSDVALSPRGVEQARALSRRLSEEEFCAFYSSDLQRAINTARIIAEPHGLPVESLEALREINFGFWEGLTMEEIQARYPRELEKWWHSPLHTRIPGGETLAEVVERVILAVRGILEKHPCGQVVVVCHGGTIRALVGSVLGMDLNQYWRLGVNNACLSILEFSTWERGILTLFNECSHLKKEGLI